jgi:hypothetical protein
MVKKAEIYRYQYNTLMQVRDIGSKTRKQIKPLAETAAKN